MIAKSIYSEALPQQPITRKEPPSELEIGIRSARHSIEDLFSTTNVKLQDAVNIIIQGEREFKSWVDSFVR